MTLSTIDADTHAIFCECYSAHQKFKALAPEKVGHNKNAKLPMLKMLEYPELHVNPFGDRICQVFSSSHDGDCTFEDFLDMMSVLSDSAPKSVKAEHAFRIYGELSINSTWIPAPGTDTLLLQQQMHFFKPNCLRVINYA